MGSKAHIPVEEFIFQNQKLKKLSCSLLLQEYGKKTARVKTTRYMVYNLILHRKTKNIYQIELPLIVIHSLDVNFCNFRCLHALMLSNIVR